MNRIAFAACTALACGGEPLGTELIDDTDPNFAANVLVFEPLDIPDEDVTPEPYAVGPIPNALGGFLASTDRFILESEVMRCTKDESCRTDTDWFWPDMTPLSLADRQIAGLGDRTSDQLWASPPDYWDTGSPDVLRPPVDKATCNGLPDQCRPCFSPDCYGGVSPGGERDTIGCSGSSINFGGPGCARPDNAYVRWTWSNGTRWSCDDPSLPGANPGLKRAIDYISARPNILPPPFKLVWTGCGPNGWPKGYNQVEQDGLDTLGPDPTAHLVDIFFQYRPLSRPVSYCPSTQTEGPGGVNAHVKSVGCTVRILERASDGLPVRRTWDNGYGNHYYLTTRGALVTIDPEVIEWVDGFTNLDRNGLNKATRLYFYHINTTAHELGHAIGLTHAYVGEANSIQWIDHAEGGKSMNPNVMPLSVMVPAMPAAPYTQSAWSSGLSADLRSYRGGTSGGGNAEAWRLSNHFRTTYREDGAAVPQNTYAPPLTETNSER